MPTRLPAALPSGARVTSRTSVRRVSPIRSVAPAETCAAFVSDSLVTSTLAPEKLGERAENRAPSQSHFSGSPACWRCRPARASAKPPRGPRPHPRPERPSPIPADGSADPRALRHVVDRRGQAIAEGAGEHARPAVAPSFRQDARHAAAARIARRLPNETCQNGGTRRIERFLRTLRALAGPLRTRLLDDIGAQLSLDSIEKIDVHDRSPFLMPFAAFTTPCPLRLRPA